MSCRFLHDFLIGLAVLACLSLNLYALVKFSGPIVLDSLCEYVSKEDNASKSGPVADVRDDDASDDDDGGMPEDVFDGISKLVARLKRRKLPEPSGEEGVPLLPTSRSSPAVVSEDSNEDDDGDQSAVCFGEETSLDSTDDAPKTASEGSNEDDDSDQSTVFFNGETSVDATDDAPQTASEGSDEADDGDQSTVCFDEQTSEGATDDDPQIGPVRPPRHPKRPSVIRLGTPASGDDVYVDPEQPLSERDGTSPEKASSESDVALAGSPEEDWFSSGRRRWIGRYDVTVARASSNHEERRFRTTAALSDGRCSELSGAASSLPEQRATYDLFVERWSSSATADATSEVSFLSDCSRSHPTGTNACGSFASSSDICSKGLQDTRFGRGPLKSPPRSSGTTLPGAHSSPDRDVIGVAPTCKFLSGPYETKHARKRASFDVKVASEKNLNPNARVGGKWIEASRNDHGKIDDAEVAGWFDDVSSESDESEMVTSSRVRDGADASMANRTLRGLSRGDGERTGDVSEPAESGYSIFSSVADSSGETVVDEEVEFREPGSRRATKSTMQRPYRKDTDA